jgi:hypothetical protein
MNASERKNRARLEHAFDELRARPSWYRLRCRGVAQPVLQAIVLTDRKRFLHFCTTAAAVEIQLPA